MQLALAYDSIAGTHLYSCNYNNNILTDMVRGPVIL